MWDRISLWDQHQNCAATSSSSFDSCMWLYFKLETQYMFRHIYLFTEADFQVYSLEPSIIVHDGLSTLFSFGFVICLFTSEVKTRNSHHNVGNY